MLNEGVRKYLYNPIVGLFPFILYVILHAFMKDKQYAIAIALSVSVVCDIIIYRLLKTRIYSLVFYISTVSLLFTLFLWLVAHNYITRPNTYLVFCEFWVVTFFMIMRISKLSLILKLCRDKNFMQKTLINSFFQTSMLVQHLFTFHLLLMLLDRQFRFGMSEIYTIPDSVIFLVLPVLMIFTLGLLQILKIRTIVSKLNTEEWLPIATEKGDVTGKIAKSISIKMKNKFLHPVIRIALMTTDGKVFLQQRDSHAILNPGKLDYPFEKYMLFGNEVNTSVQNCIERTIGKKVELKPEFLLQYVFENDDTKRLIFLYVAKVEDEEMIKREGKITGKFWTVKQMEEGFADEIFSECFELEFEYLKNMVLAPSDSHLFKPL